jgi:hypothetical protein
MAKEGVFIMHDPEIKRWTEETVFNFRPGHLKIDTIFTAAKRYQTAIFSTDEKGRLKDLGIKFSKYHSSKEEAVFFHKKLIENFIELQKNTTIKTMIDLYQEIENQEMIPLHDGPRDFAFVFAPVGNVVVGHNIKVGEYPSS